MTTRLKLDTILSSFNQDGEIVEFYFHLYLTGHFTGIVASTEGTYSKNWKDFIEDYPEFAHLTPPLTFHEQNC